MALCAIALAGAAPPIAGDLPAPAPGVPDTGKSAAFAQPRHDPPLDPTFAALVVARLIGLHLLDTATDAQDAGRATAAIKGFQAGVGLKPTGLLDRRTLALLAL